MINAINKDNLSTLYLLCKTTSLSFFGKYEYDIIRSKKVSSSKVTTINKMMIFDLHSSDVQRNSEILRLRSFYERLFNLKK